jgi:hypothetical protein
MANYFIKHMRCILFTILLGVNYIVFAQGTNCSLETRELFDVLYKYSIKASRILSYQ